MDHSQMLAGLALIRLPEDDGSGPPPAVPGHVADRLASRAATERARAAGAPVTRRWVLGRRRRGMTPATAT